MLYLIRHLVGALLSPLTAALLLAAIAWVLRLRRRPAGSRTLLIVAAALAYFGSTALVGDALLAPLEQRFPPLRASLLPATGGYVVALGSGYLPHDSVPITAALDREGLVRIVEAVRLVRHIEGARLIASGGAPAGQTPPALGYAELARELGIDQQSLVVLDSALDTAAEAKAVAALVGSAPVILVTSAYHMPRAVLEFRHAGLEPIPAPTGQLTRGPLLTDWHAWLPNAGGLGKTERALHEYVGLALLAVHPG
jgi:uncharacterized SAM-binding protein YcdF (DUF218 family)